MAATPAAPATSTVPTPTPAVRLSCVEISNFRRLAATRVDLDKATTILVGANNSGKTSVLQVIRRFLSDPTAFKSFDISLSQWSKLRELATKWEVLSKNPETESSAADDWEAQLKQLLDCMPTLDLWFDAQEGAFNYVAPFIASLKWAGGPVGVRIRLEPASSVQDLQQLAWRYREARQPVRDLPKDGHVWPVDLLDYWLGDSTDLKRVAAYKLDPAKGPLASSPPTGRQELADDARAVDLVNLKRLIRVDFVPAQRGLGSDDADGRSNSDTHRVGLFSSQLLKFVNRHLNISTADQGHREDLVKAVADAQTNLDKKIRKALEPSIEDVKALGYPGLHDPQEIHLRTRIQTENLLDHSTAVQYRLDKESVNDFLPEYSIGLGYQNLQSLSYQLVSFKASRLNPSTGSPAAVHLVMIEEPEAHLHVQVQRIFPGKARDLICSSNPEHSHLHSQLLISTHSSHLAHAEEFTRLRYLRRLPRTLAIGMPSTEVINLGDAFGTDSETRAFAERYLRVQHTDLLFADAAILVEGTAERMLVPLFIERYFKELGERYISFLDIGGSHAHRLRPFIERLGIPTVIITDIDPVRREKDAKGRPVYKAAHNNGHNDLVCGNDTLTSWHPKLAALADMANPSEDHLVWKGASGLKVRFAWQVPVASAGGAWPSAFEDSFILTNIAWFKELGTSPPATSKSTKAVRGVLGKVVNTVADYPDHAELASKLHDLIHRSFDKGEFAAAVFEHMSARPDIACPEYIFNALKWLQKELDPSTKGSM